MPSVNDWAAKCAREVYANRGKSIDRIAAIIARHAEPLLALLTERAHYHCDDSYYCCPRCDHPDHDGEPVGYPEFKCECGAVEFNEKRRKALEGRTP